MTLLAAPPNKHTHEATNMGDLSPQDSCGRESHALRSLLGWPCQVLDLVILASGLVSANALHLLFTGQQGAAELLQTRISIRNIGMAVLSFYAWYLLLRLCRLYDSTRARGWTEYVGSCLAGISCCIAVIALINRWLNSREDGLLVTMSYWAASVLIFMSVRLLLLGFHYSVRPHLRTKRNFIIVGTGSRAIDVCREMRNNPDYEYSLVGFVDSDPQTAYVAETEVLGKIEDFESILMHRVVDEVVVALPMKSQYETIGEIVAICERLGVQSQYFTHHFGTAVTKNRRSTGLETKRMILEAVHLDGRRYLKRSIDVLGSAIGLLFFLPLLLISAIAVKLSSPGPIFFCQQRFGLNKRTFPMLKFRSMVVDAEARQAKLEHLNETSGPAFKIANDPRVTSVGRFIRKTSIDELPQLLNVLLGHMSLVGPRPLPTRDVNRFSQAWLMRRFSVKPGITCLWQVGGRSETDFDRWIELDLEYIDQWSLSLDWAILFKTIPAVLKGKGAS